MPKILFNNILLFVALVVAQAVIFNNLILFNCGVALIFIYFIIEMPITLGINTLLTLSFLLGLSVDVFQDTPGLNAFVCTVIAFIKRPIFYFYVPRDEDLAGKRICINTAGREAYLKYMGTMTMIYCFLYFVVESINYYDPGRIFLRIIVSALFTFIVLYAIDSLTLTRREKRL